MAKRKRRSRLGYPSATSVRTPELPRGRYPRSSLYSNGNGSNGNGRPINGNNGSSPLGLDGINPAKVRKSDLQIAPNFGDQVIDIDDLLSASLSLGSGRIVYQNADEAVRYARRDAEKMRRDLVIESALNERISPVALLDWHLEGEEDHTDNEAVKKMCEDVRKIILRTPRLSNLLQTIQLAIWHGRYGISNAYNWDFMANPDKGTIQKFLRITKWDPVHGDTIVPDSEGNIGFKVRQGSNHLTEEQNRRIDMTVEGTVFFLNEFERQFYIIHQHRFEAPPFYDLDKAGAINGIGLRDKVFWTWKQKVVAFTWLMDFLERFGTGLNLWYYEEGNPTSRTEMKTLAENQSGRTALLVPRPRATEEQGPGFEHIEVHGQGTEKLWQIVSDYFDNLIRRGIVGQDLSSESAPTGMGSDIAAFQRETKQNLILLDAYNLAETLTNDLVAPLVRHNRRNFPDWPSGVKLNWRFEVEDQNVEEAISNAERLNAIGAKFDVDDLVDRAGLQPPKDGGNANAGPQASDPPPAAPPKRQSFLQFDGKKKVKLAGEGGGDNCGTGDGGFKPGNDCASGEQGGGSTAKSIHISQSGDESDLAENAKNILGSDSKEKILSVVGTPDDSDVFIDSPPFSRHITVNFQKDGIVGERQIFKDFDGKTVIANKRLDIPKEQRGKGIGTKIFSDQVNAASNAGVDRITTLAAGKPGGDNGYYTWARLGYDAPVSSLSEGTQQKIQSAGLGGAKDISDIMATPQGRQFWKDNGEQFRGTFDVKDGSKSRKMLDDYLRERGD